MKLYVCLTLFLTLSVVSGELLQTLRLLHQSDIFHYLSPEEQVRITEIVAAAEACKLTPVATAYGKESITALVVHMPGQTEEAVANYIKNHLAAEQQGTCVVEVTPAPAATTTRHRGN